MFDYIVIGSGLAGSVIAERIANVLNKKVLIIEKRTHIGGNCYDFKNQENITIHKYGPHLFHTDNEQVLEYLSQFTKWNKYQHKVLAFIDGKKVPIPFNLNSIKMLFPELLAKKLEKKLISKFNYGEKIPILELMESDDSDLKFLADFIYEKVFLNYTIKQWGVTPEEIDPEVTGRVPVSFSSDNKYFNDKFQFIPSHSYSKMFESLIENPNIKLLLNTDYNEVIKMNFETHQISFLGKEFKGKLIFTGRIDEFFEYKFGKLPYRTLDLKFETIDKPYFQESTVVNYPNDYSFTRISEFKHLYNIKSVKTTILKEYPREFEERDIPYYPYFTKSAKEIYNKYLEYSKKFENVTFIGRLAEYKYYDMDDVVKRALEIFDERIR